MINTTTHVTAVDDSQAAATGWLRPGLLLRAEGIAALAIAIAAYRATGGSWLLFAALLLAPDLSMLGFALGPRAGTASYNLFHTYVLPLALLAIGYGLDAPLATAIALVWIAHIGMDRAIGYGLKYPTAFKDTHLQRV